jgi:anthranilate phosphoribosyltransferase
VHEVARALADDDRVVTVAMWDTLWDQLREAPSHGRREQVAALLTGLTVRMPAASSIGAMLDSLALRRERPPTWGAVNIVGTGGGPSTFNMSTAAALLAATLGVRVVKSGSRAHASRCGSIDALELLGIALTRSYEETSGALDRFGVAFTGMFVYPPEIALMARSVTPMEMRRLGGFINRIGPLLAALPTSCQLTGVCDPGLLPLLAELASKHCDRPVWLCSNPSGVDELVSFERNTITPSDGPEWRLEPDRLTLVTGSLADLRPAASRAGVARQLLALLAGDGPPAAIESICLNAAALVVASGLSSDWSEAFHSASHAIDRGHVIAMLERLRAGVA